MKFKLWLKKKMYGYEIADHKPPKEWEIKPTDRLLLLAPHPDDETIACGGLLLRYGAQCDIVLLTDGRRGDATVVPEEMIDIRKKEFQEVVSRYGVRDVKSLGVEDGRLIDAFKDFATLDFKDYDYVLMPHPNDAHKDHQAVSCLFKRMMKTRPYSGKIVYYEVWSAMDEPSHYVDISDVVRVKESMINLYKSQIKNVDYAAAILGLNCYRAMRCHKKYVECFEIETP